MKRKYLLTSLLFSLIHCSVDAELHPAKIVNMPDNLHFKYNAREPNSTLIYKGEDENNNDTFILVPPTQAIQHLIVPKNINKDNPIRFSNPETKKTVSLGVLKTHDNTTKAQDVNIIEELKDVIDDDKIIELPKSSDTDSLSQNHNAPIKKTPEDPASSFPEHNNFFPENSEQTSVTKPPYNFWKDVLMASGVVITAALGFYYLTRNIEACARYLAGVERWSQWKSNEPIEAILLIKPESLAKELIKDIKTTYYEEPNPIALFLQDLEEEYETILQWIQFRNRIRFFGLIGTQFDFMEQRLALLDHMRQAAHCWRAHEMEIKMAHSQ